VNPIHTPNFRAAHEQSARLLIHQAYREGISHGLSVARETEKKLGSLGGESATKPVKDITRWLGGAIKGAEEVADRNIERLWSGK